MVTTSLDIVCGHDGLFGYVGSSADFFSSASTYRELTPPSTPPVLGEMLLPITQLQQRYQSGLEDPVKLVSSVFDRIEKYAKCDPHVWISKRSREDATVEASLLYLAFLLH
jgi:hypothetical protein